MVNVKVRKIVEKYNRLPVQIKASFWFLACSFFQKGISTLTTPIFTRLLSTADYGKYSVFNSWLGICTTIITLQLYAGVHTQGIIKFENKRHQFTSALEGLVVTLVLAWTGIYLVFHNFWNDLLSLTTVQVLAMLLMIWATSVYHFWAVGQRVDFKYRKLVFLSAAVSLAKPLVSIFFVQHAQDKVTARILGLALVELVGYAGLFFIEMKKGKTFFNAKYWKYALLFNLPLVPHYLSQTVLGSMDRIMISRMVSSSTAGIYSLAYSVSQIMTLFNTALLQTIEPWIYKKIKSKDVKSISDIAYPCLIFIATVNVAIIAFAPEVIAIFAPQTYYDAIWIVPPVSMSVFFMFCYTLFATFEFYFEKSSWITFATMTGAVLNIILNYVFIKLFGYYAAGYTTLFCYLVYDVLHWRFMQKTCKDNLNQEAPYDCKVMIKISGIFMIFGFIFLFLYRHIFLRYGFIACLFAMIIWKRKYIIENLKRIISLRKQEG